MSLINGSVTLNSDFSLGLCRQKKRKINFILKKAPA